MHCRAGKQEARRRSSRRRGAAAPGCWRPEPPRWRGGQPPPGRRACWRRPASPGALRRWLGPDPGRCSPRHRTHIAPARPLPGPPLTLATEGRWTTAELIAICICETEGNARQCETLSCSDPWQPLRHLCSPLQPCLLINDVRNPSTRPLGRCVSRRALNLLTLRWEPGSGEVSLELHRQEVQSRCFQATNQCRDAAPPSGRCPPASKP